MQNRSIPDAPQGWHLAHVGEGFAEFCRALQPKPGRIRKYARITVHDSGKIFGRDSVGYLREFPTMRAAAAFLNQFCV